MTTTVLPSFFSGESKTCVFQPPSLEAWISAVSVHCGLSILLGVPIAIITYSCKKKMTNKHVSLSIALCLGMMTAASMTCWPIKAFLDNLQHPWMATFLASTFGFQIFFKTLAIALEQHPSEAVDTSLANFIHWFIALPEPIMVKDNMQRTTLGEVLSRAKYFAYKICGLFVILSLSQHSHQYDDEPYHNILLRGFLHIWLIYLWASFCLDFSALGNTCLTSISSQDGFRNPLLQSRSLREAWSLRWNIPIHIFLKRIYITIRKAGYSRSIASIVVFFVSGLLHEYNFSIHNTAAYEPGKAIIFFTFMGLVVLIEDWIHQVMPASIASWTLRVPSPIISTMLVLIVAAAPVEPLFIKSWIEAGAVDAVKELLPHMTCS